MTFPFLFAGVVATAPAFDAIEADSVQSIEQVVVTGTRAQTDPRHLPFTISQISRGQLTADYRTSVLPTLTEQVPGLFITSRGLIGYGVSTGAAGSIKVRGVGGMGSLLVLVDGLPQYAGLYGHPIPDAYQTMLAEKVEVLRGPASMIYGSNAMGGVMNIVTRQMQADGSRTNINLQGGSYGTIEASASNQFRSGKFFSTVGANYSRTDGHRSNSEFEQASGFAKLGYDFNANWTLSGDVNLTYFESSNPGPESAPLIDNDMMITRGMAAASLTNNYGRTSGAVRAYFNWGHHHIDDGYTASETPQTSYYLHNDKMLGLSAYQSVNIFKGNRTTVGFDFQHYGGHAWNEAKGTGTQTDLARRSLNEVAAYVDFAQDITPWLALNAGVRLDHHSLLGNEWVPQGGLSFMLPKNATLKAMVTKGFRNPTIRELYMFRPANSELDPEKLMNYELSYKQHLLGGKLWYGINVFYLKADNLISTVRENGRPLNVNTGETEHTGVEIEGGYRFSPNFAAHANYSYLHMSEPQLAAPEHKLYLGADYQKNRFSLSGGLQYIADLYTVQGSNEQKENFWLLHLTASYSVLKNLKLFVKDDNLLAQKYEINSGFTMPRATFMAGVDVNF